MSLKSVLLVCFGIVLSVGNVVASDRPWPPGVWQDLDKIHVNKFVAEHVSRSVLIKKINQALHKEVPETRIEISFIPPGLPEINEAKYTNLIDIDVHDCTIADLLALVARYDIDWKVTGNKVVGVQSHTD